jgi:hypothetical protein
MRYVNLNRFKEAHFYRRDEAATANSVSVRSGLDKEAGPLKQPESICFRAYLVPTMHAKVHLFFEPDL